MDELEVIRQLHTTPELLQLVPGTGSELRRQEVLRGQYPAELVRAAFTLYELRKKAAAKFSRADQMWFDRQGLEQATAEPIAQHKAQRFASHADPVYDLCCGIGADAMALAAGGRAVVAVDRSALACLYARFNAEVYGVGQHLQFLQSDVQEIPLPATLIHIDPDRRAGRQRALRLEDYEPSLEFLTALQQQVPGGAIKLSPASNFGGKFPGCEVELISLKGECKEATIWFGSLAGEQSARATVLPAGFTFAGDPWTFRPHVSARGRFVYDPDPAIVRSGLLDGFAGSLGLSRLDDAEEYLTSDEPVFTPGAAGFEVLAEVGTSGRELRKYFRQGNVGELEIKCRHLPTDVESLRRSLPLQGTDRRVLILARLMGKSRALVCRRLNGEAVVDG